MVEITTLEVTAMILTPSQKTRLGIMALVILPATPTIIIPTDLAARQKKEDNTFLAMGAVQMDKDNTSLETMVVIIRHRNQDQQWHLVPSGPIRILIREAPVSISDLNVLLLTSDMDGTLQTVILNVTTLERMSLLGR